jgi:ribosomal protein S12 methylthiotransferase
VITVGLVSLGCAKNQVDSEVMLGLLRRRGFEVTHRPERADVIVVNTCGFLESAKEEGYAVIREMGALRRRGKCRRLVVAGCLVQRRAEEMRDDLPEVDQFLALNDVEKIADACDPERAAFDPDRAAATYLPDEKAPRLLTTPGPSAYLKIAEGCDNPCAFCVIPQIRGRFRSRSVASLGAEAARLAEAGVRELNLIAQDSTSYGSDIGESSGLPGLLRSLSRVDGIRWIRLLYAYPNKVTRELMDALGGTPNVLPYLDVPLQHASRDVLARMRRGGSRESFTRMIEEIRRRVPDLSLRTTLIVGFPGESETEFEELRSFVEEIEFDHVGVFTYSHEPGAPSYPMADDVPAPLKDDRRQVLLDLQESISERRYRGKIGSVLSVLVEGRGPETGTLSGRAAFQAPEVDGAVVLRGGARSGEFVDVLVEDAVPYELIGRTIGAEPRAVPAEGAAPRRRSLRVIA